MFLVVTKFKLKKLYSYILCLSKYLFYALLYYRK